MRWADPVRGLVAPDQFIGLAEESGFIVVMGEWVLAEAARAARRWSRLTTGKGLTMSVNLSPNQLRSPTPRDVVAEARGRAEPWQLDLEITESTMMDDMLAGRCTIDLLAETGCGSRWTT